jgi:exodeoxyribonuclease V alpha subunit
LPSVGPGNVLEDLLTSQYFTSVKLNKIFRQSDKSLIIKNAHQIIHGDRPTIDNKSKDFFFISKNRPKEILNEIKSLYDHRLKDFFEVDPLHDVQVLTPMKNYVLGTKNINKELQNVMNPKSSSKGEKEYFDHVFRVGDKVMQVKNNYDIDWVTDDGQHGSGIYNGDIGFIYGIDSIEQELLINFDDEKHIRYPFKQLDELRLSYAVTVHKSQGNEFPIVVIPMGWIPKPLKRRKILYTAITRAEQAIILIGNINNLYAMVDNALDFERNSGLVYRLKKRSLFYQ